MLIRLQSPSSITDILRRRSTSPGNRAATCCKDRAVSGRAGAAPPGWLQSRLASPEPRAQPVDLVELSRCHVTHRKR